MSVQHVAHALIALACATSAIAQAEKLEFTCATDKFFGNTPCGEKSYKVAPGQTLKFRIDRVEHNTCVKVTPLDVPTGKRVAEPEEVCPGSTTILWSNANERPFNVKIVIAASEWLDILGEEGLTGAVIVE